MNLSSNSILHLGIPNDNSSVIVGHQMNISALTALAFIAKQFSPEPRTDSWQTESLSIASPTLSVPPSNSTSYSPYSDLVMGAVPGLIMMAFASVSVFFLGMVAISCFRRKRKYQKIPTNEPITYDYIYRPLQGNVLDEEYENTFVGVSIPLLQDNTRI